MTNEHGFPRGRSPGQFRSLLAILLVLAGPLKGFAQTEFSEHEYSLYRSFLHDSLDVAIELAGESELRLSPEDFARLPEDARRENCAVVVDYSIFQMAATGAFWKSSVFGREGFNSLHSRLVFDLAGVEWVSHDKLNETGPEDQQKVREAQDDWLRFLEDSMDALDARFKSCLELGWRADAFAADPNYDYDPYTLTPSYASVPLEFRLREFYKSQLPALNWILDNAWESIERDRLQEFIRSMKRKYLLDP